MKRARRFMQNSLYYFLGSFSTKFLQILFVPLYTKYLLPEEFGYWDFLITLFTVLVPTLFQNIWEPVLRFAVDKQENSEKVYSTSILYCAVLCIVYVTSYIIILEFVNIRFGYLLIPIILLQMAVYLWQYSAKALQENKAFATSTILSTITTIIVNVLGIVLLEIGIVSLFYAYILANFVMVAYIEKKTKLFKRAKFSLFDVGLLRRMLIYSLPLVINNISWYMLNAFNSAIISTQLGYEANGIYAMGIRISTIMILFTTVVNAAWLEEAYRSNYDDDKDEYFCKMLNVMKRISIWGATILIPIIYLFYRYYIYGDYKSGSGLVPIMLLNVVFASLATYMGSVFLARKETNILFITTLIPGLISAGGGYLLVKDFGITGVLLTSTFGYVLMIGIRMFLINKRIRLKFDYSVLLFSITGFFLVWYIASRGTLLLELVALTSAMLIAFIFNRKTIFVLISVLKDLKRKKTQQF